MSAAIRVCSGSFWSPTYRLSVGMRLKSIACVFEEIDRIEIKCFWNFEAQFNLTDPLIPPDQIVLWRQNSAYASFKHFSWDPESFVKIHLGVAEWSDYRWDMIQPDDRNIPAECEIENRRSWSKELPCPVCRTACVHLLCFLWVYSTKWYRRSRSSAVRPGLSSSHVRVYV